MKAIDYHWDEKEDVSKMSALEYANRVSIELNGGKKVVSIDPPTHALSVRMTCKDGSEYYVGGHWACQINKRRGVYFSTASTSQFCSYFTPCEKS